MDPKHTGFPNDKDNSQIDEQTVFPNSVQYPGHENELEFRLPSPDPNFMNNLPFEPPDPDFEACGLSFTLSPGGETFVPADTLIPDEGSSDPINDPSPEWSSEAEASTYSPSEDSDSLDPVLKYINQMLMEENMENKPHMFYDHLALKATEKSLYDALGEQYPSVHSPQQPYHVSQESPNGILSGFGSEFGMNVGTNSTSYGNTNATSQWLGDVEEFSPSLLQTSLPGDYQCQAHSQSGVQLSGDSFNGLPDIGNGLMSSGPSVSEMVQNMFSDKESVLQFQRGLEEARKFLPSTHELGIDLELNAFALGPREEAPTVVEKEGKVERGNRKNHGQEDSDFEQGRNNKQSAICVDESEEKELSEMFDKVLLWPAAVEGNPLCCNDEADKDSTSNSKPGAQSNGASDSKPGVQSNGSTGGKTRGKKPERKKETVDLRSLLILCAQAVSTNDVRTANELLKQIRQHASPLGDGSQRLAYFFANGLEARLAGSGSGVQNFLVSLSGRRITAVDMLKAYKTHIAACSFKKISIFFANKMILRAAENADTLHVVDFGVGYGFQWPLLIQKFSCWKGRPPKLRITGIELPQAGFRPSELIEETGRRLAKYCEQFSVPFEYNAIAAQTWEDISIEDLKVNPGEVLAVNCLHRFKNLLDETDDATCPRNAVLDLIRKMKPSIFVHSIINGSYNAPFFVIRFREALFHFSSLFDMFDTTLPRENPERLMFEREFYGREVLNVVACEGLQRVERPETYKQWQIRTLRAGFKQLPLDQEIMTMLKKYLKEWYHRDFMIDEDMNWMLQGWKGRITFASSCWVPA